MTPLERVARVAVWTMAAFAVLFLLAPLAVTVAVSFSSSPVFTLPAPELSLRWYERVPRLENFWSALALSLHSTFADKREKLLPRAPHIAPAALVDHAERYARATTYPVQFQWTLLEGINDGDEDIRALVKLCKKLPCKVNLIEYNPIDDGPYQQADADRVAAYQQALEAVGVVAKVRRSRGKDIDAACGQLANKNLAVVAE